MHSKPHTMQRSLRVFVLGSVAMLAGLGSVYTFGAKSSLRHSAGPNLSKAASLSADASKVVSLSADPAFGWVEARGGSWNSAADLIIRRLKDAGVKRGQIISIDAHNNDPDGDAIFSAHFSKAYPSKGHLDITYTEQNAVYGWATFYTNANHDAERDITDLISITSSINSEGYAVTYVFKYSPTASNPTSRPLTWKEERAGSWNGGADQIIASIKASGAQRGQIVGIDAHNNGPTQDAIFSAVLDLNAPGYGPIADIGYYAQNTAGYGWATFYDIASVHATTDVISFTASCNTDGRAVSYVFFYA